MNRIQLHIKSLEINTAPSNCVWPIWGDIFVEVNGHFFPDKNWSDAVSSILDMWLPNLISFMCGKNKECELYFMDGPHRIHLEWGHSQEINLSMLSGDKENATTTCDVDEFINSIVSGVDYFCEHCREYNSYFLSSKTFSRIEKGTKKLRRIVAKR